MNAHPDDEAILTGGTLAALSMSGHRVVLVTLTRGEANEPGDRGTRRMAELEASARALGAAAVIDLGYADSGIGPQTLPPVDGRERLHTVPVHLAATRLAEVLSEQRAGLVLGYDAAGGYGHRDHVSVHHITRAAVAQAGGPRLLEATIPREPVLGVVRAGYGLRFLPGLRRRFAPGFSPHQWARSFTPSAQITHRVDVRPFVTAKLAALRAHASQSRTTDSGISTMTTVLALPPTVCRIVLSHEFFVEPSRTRPAPSRRAALHDVMAGLG
ncbi:MAG: PIG-L deacetylase family protein [Ornithinimicrobium sp.]